jgi:hypothetical protein
MVKTVGMPACGLQHSTSQSASPDNEYIEDMWEHVHSLPSLNTTDRQVDMHRVDALSLEQEPGAAIPYRPGDCS